MAMSGPFATAFEAGTTLGLGPAELLGRFGATRDEAAFAALVEHHGPMVLATCRRILPDPSDADDAFQATFLVLARKARSIGDPDRLAPWLHGVARRVSVKARARAARRRQVEGDRSGADAPPAADADAFELRVVIDEELARLPEKYRAPLVLCYLEGLTHDQAAGQLRWPVGTVRSRLAGGRDRLRSRLARRGLDPAEGLVPIPVLSVPPGLARLAVRSSTGAAAPARVALIARGVARAMTLSSPQTLTRAAGLLLGLALGGAAVLARPGGDQPEPAPSIVADDPAPTTRPEPPAPEPVPEKFPLTVSGRALDNLGRPIAGARIYLASCAEDDNQRLAETRTDAAGLYRFEDVPLPIRPHVFIDPKRRVEGVFQVFGRAEGFAFAWELPKHVRFGQFEPPVNSTLTLVDYLKPGEPAVVDLTFPPPAPLSGRVHDEQGKPLAGARVWLRSCTRPQLERPFITDQIDAFRGSATVPPELNERRTDADGRFTFENTPPGYWFDLDVQPRGFPSRRVTATMLEPKSLPDPWPLYRDVQGLVAGPVDAAFATPREVSFRAVAADTGQPLGKASFSAGSKAADGGSTWGVTDADGRCTLKVVAGEGGFAILPRVGTPYLDTRGPFTVPADGPVPVIEVAARAACTLEVTVVDAATGAPLADVDLWEEGTGDDDFIADRQELRVRSFEAPTLVRSDRARTGPDGTLRTFAEPGPRRVGVGFKPRTDGRVAVEPAGQAIDAKPGETLSLRFEMRRP